METNLTTQSGTVSGENAQTSFVNGAERALIVQSDKTILLDVHSPDADSARAALLPFAELTKSPEHIHTYRITPLSLWNAASAGLTAADVVAVLKAHSRFEIPESITAGFADVMSRYGMIKLTAFDDKVISFNEEDREEEKSDLFLYAEDPMIFAEMYALKPLGKYLTPAESGGRQGFSLKLVDRGTIKQELIETGWPVEDLAPVTDGEPLDVSLREKTRADIPFAPRDYQIEAARSVLGDGRPGSGYGVTALPCGSGKTIVGMAFMTLLKTNTLILTTNVAAVHQWIEELLDKTSLSPDQIAEYTGNS